MLNKLMSKLSLRVVTQGTIFVSAVYLGFISVCVLLVLFFMLIGTATVLVAQGLMSQPGGRQCRENQGHNVFNCAELRLGEAWVF